eukprot:CAMPEP_0194285018 /NCGR_PEP_ID=MMETSP0169-20130528/29148_1 /TAXON_ID=218684 /ORGANISM="Corethron pennatum, Strain L29A3" /LENGTH=335 /DNA_ID=CAMNT_0039031027 /DNA_START=320 /DNA_END=1327 /DNA_ORIENTATION=+
MSMSFEEIAAELSSSRTETEEAPMWPDNMTSEIKTSRSVAHDEIRGKKKRLERMNKSRSVPSRNVYSEEEPDADADGKSVQHEGSIEDIRLALSLGERVERLIEKSVSMVTGEKTYSWYTPGENGESLHNVNFPTDEAPYEGRSKSSNSDCSKSSKSPDLDYSKSPDLDCSNVGGCTITGCIFAENIVEGAYTEERIDPLVFNLGEAVERTIEDSVRNLTSAKSYEWTRHKQKVARAPFGAAAAAAAEATAETTADEVDDADEWIPASSDNWDLPLDEREDANEEDLVSTKKNEQQQQQEADIGASIEDSDLAIAKVDCMYAIGLKVHEAFGALG